MGWLQNCDYSAVILLSFLSLFTGHCYASDFFSIGRTLLQSKKPCPVNFEVQNYTIITSECKGPEYPPKICCNAFLRFSCPYADVINDRTSDCADTMFAYINLYGKYPPGIFASECKGDKNGISCKDVPSGVSGGALAPSPPSLLLAPPFLVLFLCFV
ncbi:PREDICTED: GPI-anchored protein LLG1-like [Ipomoea nil]|uniref:GPI-anchored protein LLG1-like n=1 Tax=Ipomoea nil TaxID=35883 RepID=UPI000900ACA4|nr:PREDICTED: GPI-anchored protein LLG1-like [Ipomoea nil]